MGDVGYEILNVLGWVAGADWPEGSHSGMFGVADDWRAAANEVRALLSDVGAAKSATLASYPSGQGGEAMGKLFDALMAEPPRDGKADTLTIPMLAEILDSIGDAAENLGSELEYAQGMMITSLIILAAEMAAAWIFPPTAPAEEAAAVAVTRGFIRIVANRLKKAILSLTTKAGWKALTKFMLLHVGKSALIGGAQDALMQELLDLQGHRRMGADGKMHGGIDWGESGSMAVAGAAGAIGGQWGHGLSNDIFKTAIFKTGIFKGTPNLVKTLVGTGAAGLSGALAGYAAPNLVKGEFDINKWGPLDAHMLVGGVAGGAVGLGNHGLVNRFRGTPEARVPAGFDGATSPVRDTGVTNGHPGTVPEGTGNRGSATGTMPEANGQHAGAPTGANGEQSSPNGQHASSVNGQHASGPPAAHPASAEPLAHGDSGAPPPVVNDPGAGHSTGDTAGSGQAAPQGNSAPGGEARPAPGASDAGNNARGVDSKPGTPQSDSGARPVQGTQRVDSPGDTKAGTVQPDSATSSGPGRAGDAAGSENGRPADTPEQSAGDQYSTGQSRAGVAGDAGAPITPVQAEHTATPPGVQAETAQPTGALTENSAAADNHPVQPDDGTAATENGTTAAASHFAQPENGTAATENGTTVAASHFAQPENGTAAIENGTTVASHPVQPENDTAASEQGAATPTDGPATPVNGGRVDTAPPANDRPAAPTNSGRVDTGTPGEARPAAERPAVQPNSRTVLSPEDAARSAETAKGTRPGEAGQPTARSTDTRATPTTPVDARQTSGRAAAPTAGRADAEQTSTRPSSARPIAGDAGSPARQETVPGIADHSGDHTNAGRTAADPNSAENHRDTPPSESTRVDPGTEIPAAGLTPDELELGHNAEFHPYDSHRQLADEISARGPGTVAVVVDGNPHGARRYDLVVGADGRIGMYDPESGRWLEFPGGITEHPEATVAMVFSTEDRLDHSLLPEVVRQRLAALRETATLPDGSPERARAQQELSWLDAVADGHAVLAGQRRALTERIRELAGDIGIPPGTGAPQHFTEQRLADLAAEHPDRAAQLAELRDALAEHRRVDAELNRYADVFGQTFADRAPVTEPGDPTATPPDCLPRAARFINTVIGEDVLTVPPEAPGPKGYTLSDLGEKASGPTVFRTLRDLRAALTTVGDPNIVVLVGEVYHAPGGLGHAYVVTRAGEEVWQHDPANGTEGRLPETTPEHVAAYYVIALDLNGGRVDLPGGERPVESSRSNPEEKHFGAPYDPDRPPPLGAPSPHLPPRWTLGEPWHGHRPTAPEVRARVAAAVREIGYPRSYLESIRQRAAGLGLADTHRLGPADIAHALRAQGAMPRAAEHLVETIDRIEQQRADRRGWGMTDAVTAVGAEIARDRGVDRDQFRFEHIAGAGRAVMTMSTPEGHSEHIGIAIDRNGHVWIAEVDPVGQTPRPTTHDPSWRTTPTDDLPALLAAAGPNGARLVIGGGHEYRPAGPGEIFVNRADSTRPDLIADVRDLSAIPDGSISEVFFERVDIKSLLEVPSTAAREIFRVLAPGGTLRIETGSTAHAPATERELVLRNLRNAGFHDIEFRYEGQPDGTPLPMEPVAPEVYHAPHIIEAGKPHEPFVEPGTPNEPEREAGAPEEQPQRTPDEAPTRTGSETSTDEPSIRPQPEPGVSDRQPAPQEHETDQPTTEHEGAQEVPHNGAAERDIYDDLADLWHATGGDPADLPGRATMSPAEIRRAIADLRDQLETGSQFTDLEGRQLDVREGDTVGDTYRDLADLWHATGGDPADLPGPHTMSPAEIRRAIADLRDQLETARRFTELEGGQLDQRESDAVTDTRADLEKLFAATEKGAQEGTGPEPSEAETAQPETANKAGTGAEHTASERPAPEPNSTSEQPYPDTTESIPDGFAEETPTPPRHVGNMPEWGERIAEATTATARAYEDLTALLRGLHQDLDPAQSTHALERKLIDRVDELRDRSLAMRKYAKELKARMGLRRYWSERMALDHLTRNAMKRAPLVLERLSAFHDALAHEDAVRRSAGTAAAQHLTREAGGRPAGALTRRMDGDPPRLVHFTVGADHSTDRYLAWARDGYHIDECVVHVDDRGRIWQTDRVVRDPEPLTEHEARLREMGRGIAAAAQRSARIHDRIVELATELGIGDAAAMTPRELEHAIFGSPDGVTPGLADRVHEIRQRQAIPGAAERAGGEMLRRAREEATRNRGVAGHAELGDALRAATERAPLIREIRREFEEYHTAHNVEEQRRLAAAEVAARENPPPDGKRVVVDEHGRVTHIDPPVEERVAPPAPAHPDLTGDIDAQLRDADAEHADLVKKWAAAKAKRDDFAMRFEIRDPDGELGEHLETTLERLGEETTQIMLRGGMDEPDQFLPGPLRHSEEALAALARSSNEVNDLADRIVEVHARIVELEHAGAVHAAAVERDAEARVRREDLAQQRAEAARQHKQLQTALDLLRATEADPVTHAEGVADLRAQMDAAAIELERLARSATPSEEIARIGDQIARISAREADLSDEAPRRVRVRARRAELAARQRTTDNITNAERLRDIRDEMLQRRQALTEQRRALIAEYEESVRQRDAAAARLEQYRVALAELAHTGEPDPVRRAAAIDGLEELVRRADTMAGRANDRLDGFDGAWNDALAEHTSWRITDRVGVAEGEPARVIVVGSRPDPDHPLADHDRALHEALTRSRDLALLLGRPDTVIEYHHVSIDPVDRGLRMEHLGGPAIRRVHLPESIIERDGRVWVDRDPMTLTSWRDVDGNWHDAREHGPRRAEARKADFKPTGHTVKDPPDGTSSQLGVDPFQTSIEDAILGLTTGHWPELTEEQAKGLTFDGAIENWLKQGVPGPEEHVAEPLPLADAAYPPMRWVLIADKSRPKMRAWFQRHPRFGDFVLSHTEWIGKLRSTTEVPIGFHGDDVPDKLRTKPIRVLDHPWTEHIRFVRRVREFEWFGKPEKNYQPLFLEHDGREALGWRDRQEIPDNNPGILLSRKRIPWSEQVAAWNRVQEWTTEVLDGYRANDSELDRILRNVNEYRLPDGTTFRSIFGFDLTREQLLQIKNHLMRGGPDGAGFWTVDRITGARVRRPFDDVADVAEAWIRLDGNPWESLPEHLVDENPAPILPQDLILLRDALGESNYLAKNPDKTWRDANAYTRRVHGADWDSDRPPLTGWRKGIKYAIAQLTEADVAEPPRPVGGSDAPTLGPDDPSGPVAPEELGFTIEPVGDGPQYVLIHDPVDVSDHARADLADLDAQREAVMAPLRAVRDQRDALLRGLFENNNAARHWLENHRALRGLLDDPERYLQPRRMPGLFEELRDSGHFTADQLHELAEAAVEYHRMDHEQVRPALGGLTDAMTARAGRDHVESLGGQMVTEHVGVVRTAGEPPRVLVVDRLTEGEYHDADEPGRAAHLAAALAHRQVVDALREPGARIEYLRVRVDSGPEYRMHVADLTSPTVRHDDPGEPDAGTPPPIDPAEPPQPPGFTVDLIGEDAPRVVGEPHAVSAHTRDWDRVRDLQAERDRIYRQHKKLVRALDKLGRHSVERAEVDEQVRASKERLREIAGRLRVAEAAAYLHSKDATVHNTGVGLHMADGHPVVEVVTVRHTATVPPHEHDDLLRDALDNDPELRAALSEPGAKVRYTHILVRPIAGERVVHELERPVVQQHGNGAGLLEAYRAVTEANSRDEADTALQHYRSRLSGYVMPAKPILPLPAPTTPTMPNVPPPPIFPPVPVPQIPAPPHHPAPPPAGPGGHTPPPHRPGRPHHPSAPPHHPHPPKHNHHGYAPNHHGHNNNGHDPRNHPHG
ncbi:MULTISPECIES: hypothetical protein [unclassified Nocardia]|uniref:WXG100-like domain-containing protein n=1 Tax=unclassified Nocardia TaxID=2637762 RepID=UPI001CE3CF6D|nr:MULTISPECIES: hypothetical protein [unclassified Nocardia]